MIPILYEKNETEFTSNGICRLRDCTKCEVPEERNGIYECDFDYPVDGINFDQIRLGRIIAVEHDDTDDIQPFDIVSYTKPINGVVSFHAVHISYRQSKIVTSGQNVTSLDAAFSMLESGQPSNPFTYWTNIFSSTAFPLADNVPRSVRECLGGVEGSILDTYGGEYEWDKFDVKLWENRGSDVDFVIRYGVNMTEYNDETDSSESYSAILPYWVGQDANNNQIVVKGALQTNGTTVSGRVDAVAMDFSQEFESGVQPTAAQLEALAQTTLTSKQPNLAAQTIKVGFIRLQDSGEYGQLANLLKCKLCDTVRVEFPRYNMSGRFKIVKTVYDVLLDRFTSMELGTLQTTLSEALGISSGSSSSYSTTGGASVLDFYPIGSYYETSDTTFDPNVTWGGTWSSETITDDAIVEEGTSGVWTYRKWESGLAECWGTYSKSIAANTVDISNYITYPFTFTERPNITIGLQAGGADLYRGHVEPSQSNTSRVRLVLINKHTSAVTLNMNMYVKGYWEAYVAPTTINRWHRTA